MGDFKGKFDSTRQDWETPRDLYNRLDKYFNFTFDLAASHENAKCSNYYTEDDNAMIQSWRGMCWLNPPYGKGKGARLGDWVKKASEESLHENCEVAMLVPARTNTLWWHVYCMHAQEVIFIKGRPKFGDAKHGLPQPLAIVYFTGNYWIRTTYSSLDLKEMEGEYQDGCWTNNK